MRRAILICWTCSLLAILGCRRPSDTLPAGPVPVEVGLRGDVLLVNLKTVPAPFILRDHGLVRMGGKVFLRGTVADIGDDPRDAGLVVDLAMDDIAAIREFTWAQAKAYYRSGFRETP